MARKHLIFQVPIAKRGVKPRSNKDDPKASSKKMEFFVDVLQYFFWKSLSRKIKEYLKYLLRCIYLFKTRICTTHECVTHLLSTFEHMHHS